MTFLEKLYILGLGAAKMGYQFMLVGLGLVVFGLVLLVGIRIAVFILKHMGVKQVFGLKIRQ